MLSNVDIDLRANEFNKINCFKNPIKWLKALRPFKHNWIDELDLTSCHFKIKFLKRDFEDLVLLLAGVTAILVTVLIFSI